MESNAFRTEATAPSETARGAVLLATVVVGLVTMFAVFLLDPFGPPVVLVSWCFLLGGLLLAVVPGSTRMLGLGLAVAGLAPPFLVFLWLWVVLTVGMLSGQVH